MGGKTIAFQPRRLVVASAAGGCKRLLGLGARRLQTKPQARRALHRGELSGI